MRARHTMNRRDYYINCTKEFAPDCVYRRGKSRRNFPSRRQPCISNNIYIYKRMWGVGAGGCGWARVGRRRRRQSLPSRYI